MAVPPPPADAGVDLLGRLPDLASVEALLHTLARAVRQFHTYPAVSPHCVDAVAAVHSALQAVTVDSLVCVVTPREVIVSGTAIGRGTPIEHELAHRLHESRCETIVIDRTATTRDLTGFCTELAVRRQADTVPLADRLQRLGIHRVNVSSAYQPVLLDINPTANAFAVVEQTRRREQSAPDRGRVVHFYPPDKGWVRVDPGLPLKKVTLVGLAQLVDEPGELAAMLASLAGDPSAGATPGDALEQRCEDVARLYTSLDPAVARVRLARLATAVLALDSQRRRRLLAHTVLPGLVDGRPEGDVLRDFPDVDLAEALGLLLDVETAAPDLLRVALERLQLSPDRQRSVTPLLEERIRAHGAQNGTDYDAALHERTQQLIQVANGDTSFRDFAAFDLRIDDDAEVVIAQTNGAIRATNLADVQLACVSQLIALHTTPDAAATLVRKVPQLLEELERTQPLPAMTTRFEALHQAATVLREAKPDVADSLTDALATFFTPARFDRLLALYDAGEEERAVVNRLVVAVGPGLAPAVMKKFHDRVADRRVAQLLGEHPAAFAPGLPRLLEQLPVPARIAAVRTLAASGPGFESHIARQLGHQSDAVVREALSALGRVGSEEAAEFVTRHLRRSPAVEGGEQVLWQFAPTVTRQCVRTLLRERSFVAEHPELILRILQRLEPREAAALGDVVSPLVSFRLRFWNLALARVGRRAAALLR